jgi:hypothetical protein
VVITKPDKLVAKPDRLTFSGPLPSGRWRLSTAVQV